MYLLINALFTGLSDMMQLYVFNVNSHILYLDFLVYSKYLALNNVQIPLKNCLE